MKKIVKYLGKSVLNILRIGISVCLMVGIFYCAYEYLNTVYTNDVIEDGSSFHNLDENSMDIIVLGSSHTQYSYIPSVIYKNTGLYSYSLGSICQPIKVSYQMLKEALKTQSPEMVILEIYGVTPTAHDCQGDSCYIRSASQMTGQEQLDTYNYLGKEKALSYINGFINNHNDWKDKESLKDLFIKKKNEKIDYDFGFIYNYPPTEPNANYWYSLTYDEDVDVNIDAIDLKYLNNIYKLCQENDIKLLLYVIPMDGQDETHMSYIHKVWDWAETKDIEYVDFIELQNELGYRMVLHASSGHPYVNGAFVISEYLSDVINNYQFENHKDNETLNSLMKSNNEDNTTYYLFREMNTTQYVEGLRNYVGTVVLKYNGTNLALDRRFIKSLNDLGVGEKFNASRPYYAIFNNGELIAEANDSLLIDVEGHSIEVNGDFIKIDGTWIDDVGNNTIMAIERDFEHYVVKAFDITNKNWTNQFYGVWESGYDDRYNKK